MTGIIVALIVVQGFLLLWLIAAIAKTILSLMSVRDRIVIAEAKTADLLETEALGLLDETKELMEVAASLEEAARPPSQEPVELPNPIETGLKWTKHIPLMLRVFADYASLGRSR